MGWSGLITTVAVTGCGPEPRGTVAEGPDEPREGAYSDGGYEDAPSYHDITYRDWAIVPYYPDYSDWYEDYQEYWDSPYSDWCGPRTTYSDSLYANTFYGDLYTDYSDYYWDN